MQCDRCRSKITDTYQSSYVHCNRGVAWRTLTAYGKIEIWRPNQIKSEKPQTIVLCSECYERFKGFMGGLTWN